jgi:hypothetical protein
MTACGAMEIMAMIGHGYGRERVGNVGRVRFVGDVQLQARYAKLHFGEKLD